MKNDADGGKFMVLAYQVRLQFTFAHLHYPSWTRGIIFYTPPHNLSVSLGNDQTLYFILSTRHGQTTPRQSALWSLQVLFREAARLYFRAETVFGRRGLTYYYFSFCIGPSGPKEKKPMNRSGLVGLFKLDFHLRYPQSAQD